MIYNEYIYIHFIYFKFIQTGARPVMATVSASSARAPDRDHVSIWYQLHRVAQAPRHSPISHAYTRFSIITGNILTETG